MCVCVINRFWFTVVAVIKHAKIMAKSGQSRAIISSNNKCYCVVFTINHIFFMKLFVTWMESFKILLACK